MIGKNGDKKKEKRQNKLWTKQIYLVVVRFFCTELNYNLFVGGKFDKQNVKYEKNGFALNNAVFTGEKIGICIWWIERSKKNVKLVKLEQMCLKSKQNMICPLVM